MSPGPILFFLMIAIMIVVGLGVLMATQMPSQSPAVTRQIARELGGHPSLQQKRHVVSFRKNNVPFRLTLTPREKGESKIKLSAPWPDPGLRIRLFPETLSDELKRFMGMQDIKTGWKKFDDAFVIQSNSEADLIRLLSRSAQGELMKIGADISVTVSGGTFAVEMIRSYKGAEDFILAANKILTAFFEIYDRSFDSAEMELVFVENEQATCMVCGDELKSMMVHCRKCNTPHHRDCWDYLGKCSTYACGSKRLRQN